ncbi:MAG: hypothetical protein J2O49_08545 [Sciscionella sp.]|nr:hypothetical protein [Sciscionella sp.]
MLQVLPHSKPVSFDELRPKTRQQFGETVATALRAGDQFVQDRKRRGMATFDSCGRALLQIAAAAKLVKRDSRPEAIGQHRAVDQRLGELFYRSVPQREQFASQHAISVGGQISGNTRQRSIDQKANLAISDLSSVDILARVASIQEMCSG